MSKKTQQSFRVVLVVFAFLFSASPMWASSWQKGPLDFLHRDHLAGAWLNPDFEEVQRDCFGCHSQDIPGSMDVAALCSKCHYDDKGDFGPIRVNADFPALGDLGLGYTPMTVFRHGEHGEMTCRECHAPDEYLAGLPIDPLPPDRTMAIRRGVGECSVCHESGAMAQSGRVLEQRLSPSGEKQALDPDRFFPGINGDPSMSPEQQGAFEHGDHMTESQLPSFLQASLSETAAVSSPSCIECHGSLLEKPAEGPERFVESAACAECHIDKEERGLEFFGSGADVASLSTGTFFHGDHLRVDIMSRSNSDVADPSAHREINEGGCSSCHQTNPDKTGRDFAFDQGEPGYSYAGCTSCHQSDEWRVPGHGDWGDCLGCHQFEGPGSDLKTDRPRSIKEVLRRRPTSFRIEEHEHPLIVGSTKEELSRDCVECHRAPVRELPSRIRDVAFNHDTHLPAEHDTGDCLQCHTGPVSQAAESWQLGGALDGVALPTSGDGLVSDRLGLTYDPDSCNECHLGSEIEANFTAVADWGDVLEFSHKTHLRSGLEDPSSSKEMSCGSCHSPAEKSATAEATDLANFFRAPADCTQCHDHKENAANTGNFGGVDSNSAESCVRCHGTAIPSRREGDLPLSSSLATRTGFADAPQHHPTDQLCITCHRSSEEEQPFTLSPGSVVATVSENQHGPTGQPRDNSGQRGGFDGCFSCHWTLLESGMSQDPNNLEVRGRLGNLLGVVPPGAFPGLLKEYWDE